MLFLLALVGLAGAYVLPQELLTNAPYNDTAARDVFLPLTAAAYAKNPQICLTNQFGSTAVMKRQVNIPCAILDTDQCSGYTATIDSLGVIVVSFRGTTGFFQLIGEGTQSIFNDQVDWVGGGKVSKYFGDSFTELWNAGIKNDFLTLTAKYPNYKIWITGHSLGGAIASLAASFITGTGLQKPENIMLITYGQPRTGNHGYAAAHDAQFTNAFRITHWRDIVPHVPTEDFEGYYHHQFEVFYKDKMKPTQYTLCQKDEDNKCADGMLITASIEEHLHYFDRDINVWGEKGCKEK